MMQLSKATFCSAALACLLLLFSGVHAEEGAVTTPTRMDIFTTTDQPTLTIDRFAAEHPNVAIQVHTLDAIERYEDELSKALPSDPDAAKQLVLKRMQRLSKGSRDQLQHSATALATALNVGVEKFPAIVFDAEFVVYGLTDPFRALSYYRDWPLGAMP